MKWLLISGMVFLSLSLHAQTYFQQGTDTKIEVTLDDRRHFLHGFETIRYTNNSPDTLRYIYLHLWPNAYSSDRTAFTAQQVSQGNTDFYFSKAADRGFIDSLDIRVGGQGVNAVSRRDFPDIARIDLPAPLPPSGSVVIETPFRVKIPKVFSRLGHQGQAYYISQWFPKPAVYDNKGWHPLPYLDQGEFFSEIGTYDVSITLPSNYVVMATGDCETVTENAWLDSLSAARPADSITAPVATSKRLRDSLNRIPPSSPLFKTVRFTGQNIHDFAWVADKRFIVRKDTVRVGPGGGIDEHTVTLWAAYLPSNRSTWKPALRYMKKTVEYLSAAVGPYPYSNVRVISGEMRAGGGMEYPQLAILPRGAGGTSFRDALVHEVGHNWFYGILASNERDHAWMDEGFNTFYERKITRLLTDSGRKIDPFGNESSMSMLHYAAVANRTDQAIGNTSTAFTQLNYGLDVYHKAARNLDWLEAYMGPDTFHTAMRDYYASWKFRHPYPADVAGIFKRRGSRPVDWAFEGAVSSDAPVDFAIKHVAAQQDGTQIRLRNRGNFAAPAGISAYKGDSIVYKGWSLPFVRDTVLTAPAGLSADYWQTDNAVPDYNSRNGYYKPGGVTHRKAPGIRPGLGIGRESAGRLFVLPAAGYNVYDGFMAGLVLHNLSLPEHRFRYILAPVYGIRSGSFAGAGSAGYWIYPRKIFSEIVPQVDFKTFHYDSTSLNIGTVLRARYIKVAPSVTFRFRNAEATSTVTRTLLLKGYAIREQGFRYEYTPSDSLYRPVMTDGDLLTYGLARYTFSDVRTFNPYSYLIEAQAGAGFTKITAEAKLRIDYNKKSKALYLRGFAGKYIQTGSGDLADSRYYLTAGFTPVNDYLYDGTYLGRSEREGFAARQVSIQEGGGKLSTPFYGFPLGRSDDWLAGINIKTDLPLGRLPVRLYLDVATHADADKVSPSASRLLYSGGIELHALRDILLLHFPLVMSGDYSDYLKSIYPDKRFANSISFAIQLQNINWLRTASSVVGLLTN